MDRVMTRWWRVALRRRPTDEMLELLGQPLTQTGASVAAAVDTAAELAASWDVMESLWSNP